MKCQKKKKEGKDISAVTEESKKRCYWRFSCIANLYLYGTNVVAKVWRFFSSNIGAYISIDDRLSLLRIHDMQVQDDENDNVSS